eukprot:gene2953-4644_t
MGYDDMPVPSAPPDCQPFYPLPYVQGPPLQPVELALETELGAMGLLSWAADLAKNGMVTVAALKLAEELDDLPDSMPKLAKKQLLKRAEHLRQSEGQSRCPIASSPVPVGDQIEVTVRIVSENKSFKISAYASEKMGSVRTRFPSFVPVPSKVCFDGTSVDDHVMLTDANIVQGSTLFLIPTKTGPVCLYAKTSSGTVFTVDLPLYETVGALRGAISIERKCPAPLVRMMFKSRELTDDSIVLQTMDVAENSCFRLL